MAAYDDMIAALNGLVVNILGGKAVTYTPSVGAAVEVTGMYDSEWTIPAKGDRMESTAPGVLLVEADLPSDPSTDTGARLTIDGTEYAPRDVKRDGSGTIIVYLRRTS